MGKDQEPKRLCRCGCGKMLSARAERRHRDGQVPPRIAAVQKNQTKVSAVPTHLIHSIKSPAQATSTAPHIASSSHQVKTSGQRQDDDIDMDHHSAASGFSTPNDNSFDDDGDLPNLEPDTPVAEDTVMTASIEPATAVIQDNRSVSNARAAVWTEWRARREKVTLSDDEENENTPHGSPENSEDDLLSDDEDSELDCHSVDDEIEAEWEKERAEMGENLFNKPIDSSLFNFF
jgi:hypothetical protein